MLLPTVPTKASVRWCWLTTSFRWRATVERLMASNTIVINGELAQLPREISCIPEENAVKILAPESANQPFHKRMRSWSVGYGLNLLDLEHP